MLRKLIKYDLKALNRFLIIVHAFLILAAILGRIFITSRAGNGSAEWNTTVLVLGFILSFLLLAGATYTTAIVAAVRFYRNMFSDEGYLTHTLPVSTNNLLLSKTITGSIWAIIDSMAIYLSWAILFATPYVIKNLLESKTEIMTEFGAPNMNAIWKIAGLTLLVSLVGSIHTIIAIHFSIIIGQLMSNHRILGAIVAYFSLSLLISLITMIAMRVTGLLRISLFTTQIEENFHPYSYYCSMMRLSLILVLATSLVLYVVSQAILRKKLNLN